MGLRTCGPSGMGVAGHGPAGRRSGRTLPALAVGLPAVLTFAAGLAVTTLAWDRARRDDAAVTHAAFDRRAGERAAAAQLELSHVGGMLEAIRSLYAASEYVSESEFDLLSAMLRPSNAAVPVLLRIERGEAGAFAVARTTSRDGVGPMPGFDVGREAAWRGALDRARDEATFAATGALGPSGAVGFPSARRIVAIVLPTYAGGIAPEDPGDRRASLSGFAAALVDLDALVEFALEGFVPDVVGLEVDTAGGGAAPSPAATGEGERFVGSIGIGAVRWTVIARPLSRFRTLHERSSALAVLVTGSLASLLAALAAGGVVRRGRLVRRELQRRSADLLARTRERDAELVARRRAASALRRSEERFHLLLDGVRDYALFLVGPDGSVSSWNSGARQLTGYESAEIVARQTDLFYSPEDVARGEPQRLLSAAERDGRTTAEGWRVRCDGSRFWAEVTVTALREADGSLRGFAKIVRDVTARREAEDEIRRLNVDLERRVEARTAELEAANRELEAFSYSVSHDLRAPLRAMSGYANVLIEDHGLALDAESRRCVDAILDAAREMSALIDDLLAFSRLSRQPLTLGPVDVGALVGDVVRDLAPQRAGRDVEIEVGPLPVVLADRAMLKQVFFNLVENAHKFTRTRATARIQIDCERGADGTVFRVQDNGVGFDMRYADQLFGVFQRLHRADEYEGTGVGLALVQRIVLRHGGRVWAESRPGEGATFRFTLGRAGP